MKQSVIDYLQCPHCLDQNLEIIVQQENGEEIKEGKIICPNCDSLFMISNFIPNFLPKNLQKIEIKVREGFGYKWKLNPSILHTYKKRFFDEIFPVKRDFLEDKVILNACCGIGIIDYYCAQSEAKETIGFDISDAVYVARENCLKYNNTNFIKADLFGLPFKPCFDYVLCLAAIHHLKNPAEGFNILTKVIKKGGYISIWVYANEGNEFVRFFIEPFRRYISTKLPLRIVSWISMILGMIMWVIVKLVYYPCKKYEILKKIGSVLPMKEYLFYIESWPFRQVQEMIFDQLLSPITYYHRREEIEEWVKDNNLKLLSLTRLNDNSWRCFAQKCAE